jgi:hypothetical protein
LFESRSKAFKDGEVLQENIIIFLERGGQQGAVTVSISTDDAAVVSSIALSRPVHNCFFGVVFMVVIITPIAL